MIDSIVRLTEDTAPNAARAEGKAPSLKRSKFDAEDTEQKLVSRNGGVPFAVLQLEPWNPSTPTQKMNNLNQLIEEHPTELDS